MRTPRPTTKDIDALLAFLPRLYAAGFKPVRRWGGGEEKADGVITMPWPDYDDTVHQFIAVASKRCWDDFDYDPAKIVPMIRNKQAIKHASLDQVKSILTYCVRGERFCDGHWGAMIEQGVIRALLERLQQLRAL